ncbi:vWA domain-containing protein [Streptomyces sp. NRRL F-4489]|uniref:vWA domain-containing protein n=1 Tax=Streptomyces sp. NRRL F-4489 TaxID=1609095 RepID=UPI002D21B5D4|nr:VWA domain-containing protein [Streptomyces sp. NRRL F-4489]
MPAEAPVRDEASVRDEPSAEAPVDAAAAVEARAEEAAPKAVAKPEPEAEPATEPEAKPAAEAVAEPEPEEKQAPEAPAPSATEPTTDAALVSDLVSQAFDNPASIAAPTASEEATEPKPEAQPEKPEQPENPEQPAAEKPQAEEPSQAAEPGAPEPEAAATAPAATTPNPVAATAPGLLPLYDAARATLEKHQLTTQRATVYLVLDRSGSMRNYYKDGTVQHLAEQALALSAHLDEKATVPVVFFSTDVDGTAELDLTTYEGRIEELHSGLGHMGRTNYHWAIEAVVAHYKKSGSTDPAFVIFQTDGAPTSKPAAERALCEAAGLPVFWQFIGFGDPEAKGFDFLRKLDDLTVPEKRVVDNAGFFHAGRDPRALSHEEFFQQLMVEFPEWLAEARAAKVVKDS